MYIIKLKRRGWDKPPHVWTEYGETIAFFTKEKAEKHAKQIRRMKDIYESVTVELI